MRPPRIVESPAGMLNAIGLPNDGVERFVTEKLPYLATVDPVVLVSIMGLHDRRIRGPSRAAGRPPGRGRVGTEPVLSQRCLQRARRYTRMFAHDPVLTGEVQYRAVRAVTDLPVIAKLGPDVADIAEIGRAAEDGGGRCSGGDEHHPRHGDRHRPSLPGADERYRRPVRSGDPADSGTPHLPIGECGKHSGHRYRGNQWIIEMRCSSCWPVRARYRSAPPPSPTRAPQWKCWRDWQRYLRRSRSGTRISRSDRGGATLSRQRRSRHEQRH